MPVPMPLTMPVCVCLRGQVVDVATMTFGEFRSHQRRRDHDALVRVRAKF